MPACIRMIRIFRSSRALEAARAEFDALARRQWPIAHRGRARAADSKASSVSMPAAQLLASTHSPISAGARDIADRSSDQPPERNPARTIHINWFPKASRLLLIPTASIFSTLAGEVASRTQQWIAIRAGSVGDQAMHIGCSRLRKVFTPLGFVNAFPTPPGFVNARRRMAHPALLRGLRPSAPAARDMKSAKHPEIDDR